ncbi:TPA: hypothetical protein ACH3X3_009214 [Trebouxia sp. C0006]
MPATMSSATGHNAMPALSLDSFKGQFNITALMDKISNPVLEPHRQAKTILAKTGLQRPKESLQGSLQVTEQLVEHFDKAEKELRRLQSQLDRQMQKLQRSVGEAERDYQAEVIELEAVVEEVHEGFQSLDQQMSRAGQTATKIGDRLQSAESLRSRAEEAISCIQYMQNFAACTDFAELPELFQDSSRLSQAAAMTGRLLSVARDVSGARERAASPSKLPVAAAKQGSIEQAAHQLEAYRALLEKEVIASFDKAVHQKDLGTMAECAQVMTQFERGDVALMQRYISTRPLFIDARELALGQGAAQVTDTSSAITALRSLAALYKAIVQAVKDEAIIMEQVFPAPGDALVMFVTRLYEQRVQASLDRLLVAPAPTAAAETLQQHMKLVTEAFKRTMALAESLQEVVGEAANVADLANAVFSDILGDYPDIELQWLRLLHQSKSSQMSVEIAQEHLTWNLESVERCTVLSTEASCPSHVRQLFHAAANQQTPNSCLLQQISRLVLTGLAAAEEAGLRASQAPYGVATAGSASRTAIAKAASVASSEGLGRILDAMGTVSVIIGLVQQHHVKVIQPRVEASGAEAAACNAGLTGVTKSVEDRVLASLQAGLTAFFAQVDRTLTTEQKRIDFRPPEDLPPPLDRPTDACLFATSLLTTAAKAVQQLLHGTNSSAFTSELAHRMGALLLNHMQRYSYSPTGALRWKRDITEYTDCIHGFDAQSADDSFTELASLVNILLVAPERLLGLIDGSLRISHQQALKYIKLREDFKTAKIGSSTLAMLFAND